LKHVRKVYLLSYIATSDKHETIEINVFTVGKY